jgi:carboxyl-terminal processing protease
MPFEELLDLVRGESAQKVHLKLERKEGLDRSKEASSYTVDLEPAMITINDGRVETSYVPYQDGIIATIVLRSFYKGANGITSENDVSRALAQLQKVGPIKGLILDLRGNPGGFLTQAVKVAGLFLTSGVVVISKYANGEERYYRDINGTTDYQGPMVVLTSKTTASAAEIVSQALQDYGVALVVGDVQTYGKGTIQSQTVTADQNTPSYFKVTVGTYYTVSGKTPQKQGVKADIVVPGEFSLDYIGEQYDDEAPDPDTIVAVYTDPLADVPANLKPWFQRYYVPTLQKRQQGLQALLPALRKQSFYRLHHSPEYKKFMTMLVQPEATVVLPKADVADWHALQHREAINIVKDMIALNAKERPESSNTQ